MALELLPRDHFFFTFLPAGVVDLDTQGIIQAVVGGYQDHSEDLRTFASKFEYLIDPLAKTPEGSFTDARSQGTSTGPTTSFALDLPNFPVVPGTVKVTFLSSVAGDDQQGNIQPSGQILGGTVNYETGHVTVSTSTAGIGVLVNYKFIVGTDDPFRRLDANLIFYLAATIGAVLYKTQTTDPQLALEEQRRILAGYFPRLKIKGTANSFELLGRIAGFGDVKFTPLWGRVSPRLPNDVGNAIDDPDFAEDPEIEPTTELGGIYDPLDQDDGPFFSYASGSLSQDQTNTSFWPEGVNGFNPFVNVVVTSGTLAQPAPGSYVLANGGPHALAYVDLGASGFRLQAISEGDSFNGITAAVSAIGTGGSLRELSITDRLSTIKYRTSYYNLTQTFDIDRFVKLFGSLSVSSNPDLVSNPTLDPDGTAVAPFRPWKGAMPRTQATALDRQLNLQKLKDIGLQTQQVYEEVRPMTRTPRQVLVGFLVLDSVIYAAFPARSDLFVTDGSTVTFDGTATGFPLAPYTAIVTIEEGSQSILMTGEQDPNNANIIQYRADNVDGFYDFSSNQFHFDVNGYPAGTTFVARWIPTSTEVIRPEPSLTLKAAGSLVGYQARPEDETTIPPAGDGQTDENPWRRDIQGGGEDVDLNAYRTYTPDERIDEVGSTMSVQDQTGVEYLVTGFDPARGTNPSTIRTQLTAKTHDLDTYLPSRQALAIGTGDTLYPVGAPQGILVADPNSFFGSAHRDGLVGWFAFNQHPDDDLAVVDSSATASVQTLSGVLPEDRVFDSQRAWYLSFHTGSQVSGTAQRNLGTALTLSFWIRPGAASGVGTPTIITFGGLTIKLSNSGSPSLSFFLENSSGVPVAVGSLALTQDVFNYVYIRKSGGSATLGLGNLSTPASELSAPGSYRDFDAADTGFSWVGGQREFGIHDVRLWSVQKGAGELDRTRVHPFKKTIVAFKPTHFLTRARRVPWALQVLDSGYVIPTPLPPAIDIERPGRVTRYDDQGRFTGESKRKEVGLGGGQTPPLPWKLGTRYHMFEASNQKPVSTQHTALPGSTDRWDDEGAPGFVPRTEPPYGPSGGTNVLVATGTLSPWPNQQEAMNAGREYAWLRGEDGLVYEITVLTQGSVTSLQPELVTLDRDQREILRIPPADVDRKLLHTELPTGANVDVVRNIGGSSKVLSVIEGVDGLEVFEKNASGTLVTRPDLYLYNHSQSIIDIGQTEAFDRWDNPTDLGTGIFTPAREDAGILSFSNPEALPPGNYKITFDVGNIGQVDPNFEGFDVTLTIGNVTTTATLLPDGSGLNPRGRTTVEFTITVDPGSPWPLIVDWTNALSIPERNQFRRLAIFGYEVSRFVTQLWRVDLNPFTIVPIDVNDPPPEVPGGWLLTLNSYGSVADWTHESNVFPSNDTFSSRVSLAGLLTGATADRREDVLIVNLNGSGTDPEPVIPDPPLLGPIT